MCQCSPKDIWEHLGCSNNFPVGPRPLEHFELCFRKTPDFSSIQHSRQGEDDVQLLDVETPKPTPSRVEGKKEDHSKVLLTVEGDVDLRIPRCKYS